MYDGGELWFESENDRKSPLDMSNMRIGLV